MRLLKPLGYRGFYFHSGRFEPVESFDPERLQNAAALDADGTNRLPGRTYINNFIFAARPHVLNVALLQPVSENNMGIDKQWLAVVVADEMLAASSKRAAVPTVRAGSGR